MYVCTCVHARLCFNYVLLLLLENVLDRHIDCYGDHIAIIWEKDEPGENEFVTYQYVT